MSLQILTTKSHEFGHFDKAGKISDVLYTLVSMRVVVIDTVKCIVTNAMGDFIFWNSDQLMAVP